MYIKKLIRVSVVILGIFFLQRLALAGEQFSTNYIVKYSVYPNGETYINQNIQITNNENDILATNYAHTIKQMEIYDVTGKDRRGPLDVEVITQKDSTTVKTALNEQVIGKGRTNDVTLMYKTKDVANKVGEVWNINLPQVAALEETDSYDITLTIPKSFGPMIFIAPTPKETITTSNETSYIFDKQTIDGKNVTAAFGKYQLLNFKLKYHLKNDGLLPMVQEIALPLDIHHVQQTNLESIKPKPKRIYQDGDGNILAQYKIPSRKDLEIELTGSVRIMGRQINPEFGGKMHELPINLKRKYTKDQPFWEVDSAQIQEIANDLFDPQKTVAANAQTVYNYIIENLKYNFEITKETTIERKGALTTLTNEGLWACMEFTDVFVALTRAMGIPARELDGYAINNGENLAPLPIDLRLGDLLHAWAEFYDPNFGWVQVDPTWGTTSGIDYFTKLDTNHFAFVTKGESSEYPYPAGSYRIDDAEEQVFVDFAQEQVEFRENITLYKKPTLSPLKLLLGKQKYTIHNTGGTIVYDLDIINKNLLPFEKQKAHLPRNNVILKYKDFNGTEKELKPTIQIDQTAYIVTTISGGLVGAIAIVGSASILIKKRKKATS